jgi:hypothetical protein
MLYKNVVRTSQETHYVSTTETNRLLMFGQKKLLFIVRTIRNAQTHCVGQNEEF